MNKLIVIISIVILNISCKTEPTKPTYASIGLDQNIEKDSITLSKLPDTLDARNHSFIMDAILGKPKYEIKNIGILVYDGVNDLDMMGPRYIFGQSGAKTELISIDSGSFKTVMGLTITPDKTISDVNKLDILIIPGGAKGTLLAAYNTNLAEWIRMIDKNTTYTASVCTGGWILGATGLLKGKRACTNWYKEDDFLQKYGAISTHTRYTNDGKYWSSAGVTAGMDMSLAIINDNWGKKYTQGIMLDMEYDPAPPIEGGSPEKTGMMVRWMMKAMYDASINPVLDSLEQIKKK